MRSRRVCLLGLAVAAACGRGASHGPSAAGQDAAPVRRVPDGDIALPASRMQQGQLRYLGVAGERLVALSWDGALGGSGGSARDRAKNALQVWDLASRSVRARVDAVGEPSAGDMEVGGFTVPRAAAATLISASSAGDRVVTVDLSGRVAMRKIDDLSEVWSVALDGADEVAMSGDGRRVLVGDRRGTLYLLDAADGRTLWSEPTGHGDVTAVAISDDGTYVASAGSADDAAEVRDAATRAVVARIRHGSGPYSDSPGFVLGIAFAPGGDAIATIGFDPVVGIHEVPSGAWRATLSAEQRLDAVAWSPDGAWIAAGGRTDARLWRADGTPGPKLETPDREQASFRGVEAIAFTPDGGVVTGEPDDVIRVWDRDTGALRRGPGHDGEVFAVAATRDGEHLVTGGRDRQVVTWDLVTGQPLARIDGDGGWTIAPDGAHLARVDRNRIVLVRLSDGAVDREIPIDALDGALSFSSDGARLALRLRAEVRIYDVASGAQVARLAPDVSDIDPSLSAGSDAGFVDRDRAVWLLYANVLFVLDVESGATRSRLSIGQPFPFGVDVAADASAAAFQAFDGGIAVWDLATGARRFALPDLRLPVFSPDGATVAAAAPDGTIALVDARTGAIRETLPGHPDGVSALAFTPGGRVVSGGADGHVVVWRRR